MSRAEKFISEHTRNCSNEMESPLYANPKLNFYPWLTPDQVRMAVEIAREEMIEWLKDNASNYIINTTPSYPDADFSAFVGGKCWEDLKQAMKDE